MTAVMTREPLQTLNMASTQRTTRRRTVIHAFEDEDESAQPAAKRAKTEKQEKQVNGTAKRAKACKSHRGGLGCYSTRTQHLWLSSKA